jgi:hypothetical protein
VAGLCDACPRLPERYTSTPAATILHLVQEHPGLHLRDVARRLKQDPSSTTSYWLRPLLNQHVLVVYHDGVATRFFLNGTPLDFQRAVSAARRPQTRRLLEHYLQGPRAWPGLYGLRELNEALRPLANTSILHHLHRLLTQGTLVRQRSVGGTRYALSPSREAVEAALLQTQSEEHPATRGLVA